MSSGAPERARRERAEVAVRLSTGAGAERRRRLRTRALPLAGIALLALLVGVIVGGFAGSSEAERFVDAWERADVAAMYAELAPESAAEYPLERFSALYEEAWATATLERAEAGGPDVVQAPDGSTAAIVPMAIETYAFGDMTAELELPLADERVVWTPELVFPGLEPGERLSRRTEAPERAAILAADGTPLAEGEAEDRGSTLAESATDVAGELSEPEGEQAELLRARGFSPHTPVGASGLELAFDERLAGQPGGELLAATPGADDERVLAGADPVAGTSLETTVDADLQTTATGVLGGRQGGVAVLDTDDGSVLALAGAAYSAPQPPGSTFKVVTTTAALDSQTVSLSDKFPIRVSLEIDGRRIKNADPPCGGSLEDSFAHSCNSVFAPLGVEMGSEPLLASAEDYGFNAAPTLFGSEATRGLDPPSSVFPATLDSDRALALAAIGEGAVRATPLQLASVAQTVAAGGVRSPTPIVADESLRADAAPVRVTSEQTAATLRDFMTSVVSVGTAAEAGLPAGQVAGKTGTAELKQGPLRAAGLALEPSVEKPLNAWFLAFAPVREPQLAVAVLILDSGGDGGSVAAPVARDILAAGVE